MNFLFVSITLSLLGSALAGVSRPEVSVVLNAGGGAEPSIDVIQPSVYWGASDTIGDFDIEGGLTVQADVKSNTIPFRGWAKIKRSAFGIQSSARFDVDSENLNKVGVDLAIIGGPTGTGLLVSGSVDTEQGIIALENVKVSQNVDSLGGVWSVVPSYNVASQKSNVKLAYGTSGISVSLDADVDQQKITVAKGFGANVIAPSITNQGDVEVQFTRILPTGSVVATIKSNDSVNIKWSDGKWVANVKAPLGKDFVREAKVTLSCTGVNL